MKPILEHFEDLPEPYRSQAIENYGNDDIDLQENNLSESLYTGFIWETSTEGYDYWEDIYTRALSGEFDKQK